MPGHIQYAAEHSFPGTDQDFQQCSYNKQGLDMHGSVLMEFGGRNCSTELWDGQCIQKQLFHLVQQRRDLACC